MPTTNANASAHRGSVHSRRMSLSPRAKAQRAVPGVSAVANKKEESEPFITDESEERNKRPTAIWNQDRDEIKRLSRHSKMAPVLEEDEDISASRSISPSFKNSKTLDRR